MISIYYPMPDKNKTNLGLAPVFLLIQRCARCLPYSINALARLVLLNIILRYVKNAYYSHNSLAKASIFSAFSSFNAERIRTVF